MLNKTVLYCAAHLQILLRAFRGVIDHAMHFKKSAWALNTVPSPAHPSFVVSESDRTRNRRVDHFQVLASFSRQ